jgi:hypothetical protein
MKRESLAVTDPRNSSKMSPTHEASCESLTASQCGDDHIRQKAISRAKLAMRTSQQKMYKNGYGGQSNGF